MVQLNCNAPLRKYHLPIFKRVGDTNAVSAAYENSIPITAADIFVSSQRFFLLKNKIYVSQINFKNRVNDEKIKFPIFELKQNHIWRTYKGDCILYPHD